MGDPKIQSPVLRKNQIVPKPYERQRSVSIGWLDAWRCLHCPVVRLSIRSIERHCFVEHGIWKRKKTASTEVPLRPANI